MKVHVHFFQLNKSFSQELADEKHEGKESPDNMKYWWEDAFVTKSDVFKVSQPIKGAYTLQAWVKDEEKTFTIPDVVKFQLLSADHEVTELVVSESILERYEQEKLDENNLKLSFYIKDDTVFTRPVPGQYFEVDDFPNALKE